MGIIMMGLGFLLLFGIIYAILSKKIYFIFLIVFFSVFLIIGGFSSLIGGMRTVRQYIALTDTELTCNSYYGETAKLQYDKIIGVTKHDGLKSVAIQYGASRPLYFTAMLNYMEVYEFLTNKANNSKSVEEQSSASDVTEQVKKYKDLLDQGIITQEEFDAKKKQLLGL